MILTLFCRHRHLIAPRSLRRGWVIQPRGPHLCPRFARHGGSTRLRDISGHHIGPLPDAPQNKSESDKAGRKSKPDTGNEQNPERQKTSVLNHASEERNANQNGHQEQESRAGNQNVPEQIKTTSKKPENKYRRGVGNIHR